MTKFEILMLKIMYKPVETSQFFDKNNKLFTFKSTLQKLENVGFLCQNLCSIYLKKSSSIDFELSHVGLELLL